MNFYFNFKSMFVPKVTNNIYNQFINTGKVPVNVLKMIAFKVIKQETLSQQEMAIFTNKTGEINELIIKITNK